MYAFFDINISTEGWIVMNFMFSVTEIAILHPILFEKRKRNTKTRVGE
jgi:hypothetical protein